MYKKIPPRLEYAYGVCINLYIYNILGLYNTQQSICMYRLCIYRVFRVFRKNFENDIMSVSNNEKLVNFEKPTYAIGIGTSHLIFIQNHCNGHDKSREGIHF